MVKKLALLIGVSNYGEGFEPLTAPPNDVAAMERVLIDPDLGGFNPANVTTLFNPDQAEMQKAILRLFDSSTKDDLIVLFFSGHGITNDDNHLYFCTSHTSKRDYLATAVPASFIQNLSNNFNYAKRQVMIFDCCYSGAFATGWRRKGDIPVDLERELGKEGRVVLTSSSATQVSWQQEDAGLSLYTQYLVEGLETGGADEDRDGEVKVRELHNYAKRKVQEVKPRMKPDIIVADDEGYDILISRVQLNAALRFRQSVEESVDPDLGDILDIDLELLEVRAQRLGVSSDQAQQIIASVLEPFRRRRRNLSRYREKYAQYVDRKYPLSSRLLQRLHLWQEEVLGLEDKDVAPIQQEFNRLKEAESEDKRKNLLKKAEPIPSKPQVLITSPASSPSVAPSPTTFSPVESTPPSPLSPQLKQQAQQFSQQQTSSDFKSPSGPRMDRLLLLTALGVVGLLIMWIIASRIYSWISQMTQAPILPKEQLELQLNRPPVPIPVPNPVTNLANQSDGTLTSELAEGVIRAWLKAKQAAMGPNHDASLLQEVLIGGPLASWQNQVNNAQQGDFYFMYNYPSLVVEDVSWSEDNPDTAAITISITEARQFYDAGELIPGQSDEVSFGVVYGVIRDNGRWKIQSISTQ